MMTAAYWDIHIAQGKFPKYVMWWYGQTSLTVQQCNPIQMALPLFKVTLSRSCKQWDYKANNCEHSTRLGPTLLNFGYVLWLSNFGSIDCDKVWSPIISIHKLIGMEKEYPKTPMRSSMKLQNPLHIAMLCEEKSGMLKPIMTCTTQGWWTSWQWAVAVGSHILISPAASKYIGFLR